MQSTQQPIFFQTIPNTAGPTDPRIVIGNNIPSELLTWAQANNITITAVILEYFGSLGSAYAWQGVGVVGVTPCYFTGTWDNQNGVYLLNRVFLTGLNQIWETIGSATLNSSRLNYSFSNVKVDVLGTSADGVELLGDDVGGKGGRIDSIVLGQGEFWHSLTLQNGWTNRAGYAVASCKLIASPPNCVMLRFNIAPGTKADGTVLFQLPNSNYYPSVTATIPCNGGGTLACVIEIDNTGTARCFGASTASFIQNSGGVIICKDP